MATRTRPDISTAVSMLGKFQSDPSPAHWKALKYLLRYVAGTTDFGLFLPSGKAKSDVQAWSDAYWARDHSKRRSRFGFLLAINRGPVIWSSKHHTATAESTTEADFSALVACVREVK